MSMLFKRIKDWATSITSFRTGDVIPVDGPSGTAKMSKDDLLKETAQNALLNVAPAFVPNNTNTVKGMPYSYGGKLYIAKEYYNGAWDASKFTQLPASKIFAERRYIELASNAYLGYYVGIGGGAVVISYRIHGSGTGLLLVNKIYSGSVQVTNVSNGLTSPLGFYFDGVRVAIKNKSGQAIDTCVVNSVQDNFVEANSLPPNWDSEHATEVTNIANLATETFAANAAKSQKYSTDLANNAYLGYFPGAGGGSLVIEYRERWQNQVGLVMVSKAYGGNVKITNVSNNLACPFEFSFDGVRVSVKNTSGEEIDYCILNSTSSFVVVNSLPPGWDAESATAVPVEEIAQIKPVDLTSYATKSYTDSAVISGKRTTELSANAYYGNFPNQGGGAIIIEWRKHNDGNGLLFINKPWSQPIKALNISNSIPCPLKVLTDGTRLVVQNGWDVIDVCLVATCSNFVLSSSLPSYWNSGNVSEITPTNLYPIDPTDIDTDQTIDLSLVNSCARYRRDDYNKSDFSAVIVTDSHADDASVSRAVKYGAASPATSAIVHCGDFVLEYLAVNATTTGWAPIVAASTKATYFVQGNHEKGTHWSLKYMPSDETLYNLFVKPIVDKGYLVNGEYEVNKCYYYHDFTATKTRLVVLDEDRAPMDYSEGYWRAIPYESSLPDSTDNTDYHAGDRANVEGFTRNSFEAVQDLNSGSYWQGRQPIYKVLRGCRYIDQIEAQWFLDTLYNTPEDYEVVVALHNPFSDSALPVLDSKFTQKDLPSGYDGSVPSQNYMATDFIADALNAFMNASNFSETVTTKQNTEASYIAHYSVSKDFSQRDAGKVLVLFGGHVHRDIVWRHPTYTELYQITPMTSNTTSFGNYKYADICLQSDASAFKYIDSLTSVSAKEGRIALCKIGVKATTSGELRDIEVIDTST